MEKAPTEIKLNYSSGWEVYEKGIHPLEACAGVKYIRADLIDDLLAEAREHLAQAKQIEEQCQEHIKQADETIEEARQLNEKLVKEVERSNKWT